MATVTARIRLAYVGLPEKDKMRSSPPERAWQKPPSPTGSQYSLDPAALDLHSHSGASSPLPEQHVDRIRSEDIDGPSDFTLNMETWVRGGTMGRGTTKSMKKALESLRERRDEGVQANESLLTPRKAPDEEQSASHHTPSDSPPLDSVFDMRPTFDQPVGEVSECDPYADAEESTPEPPAHKNLLQPTVEDYYSELTPARMPSMRRAKSTSSRTQVAEERNAGENEAHSTPGRPSSETLSPVRSPARSPVRSPDLHRAAPRQFSSQSTEATFEKQMEELQAKCNQLELLNVALGQAVDEERRTRAEDKAAQERRMADAERREHELREMKDQAYLQRDDYRRDLSELKANVEQQAREHEESCRGLEAMRQQCNDDMRKVSADAQRQKSDHLAALRALDQELELMRRSRDAAEESERGVRAELDRHHAEADENGGDDLDRMQSDLTQIEDPKDRMHELEEEQREMKMEMEKLRAAKKEAEEETSGVRAELAGLQRGQDQETSRLTADHRRAVAVAEDLQAQLRKLRDQLLGEQSGHKAEIERMRENGVKSSVHSPAVDLDALRAELETKQTELNTAILERDALRDDLESQQSKLNAAILERDDAQDSLAGLQTSLQEAREALADHEAVSTAIDAKVSTAIAKREAYWRGRLDASEQERKIMVKALLRQWGREELGVTEKELEGRQGYEYQFVKKSRRSSGADAKAGA